MKRFVVAWLFCLPLCLLLTLTGCGKKEDAPCTHENVSDWIIDKYATCQQQGIRHKECLDCGTIITTQSYHIGHQYENGVCIVCGRAKYDEQYLRYRACTVDGFEGYAIAGIGDCKSKRLNIPETYNDKPVLAIDDRAFSRQSIVTDVTIPKTVVSIGAEAFRAAESLRTVVFAPDAACTSIGPYAFSDCPSLVSFEVPERVTRLHNSLFAGDAALEDLSLHDGINAVGVAVFDGCVSLPTIEKNGLVYLGNGDNPYFLLLNVTDKTAVSLTPEAGLKIVGAYAFMGCRNLTTLTLPAGVISISDYALHGCAALQSVQLPVSLSTVGAYAFVGCTTLSDVALPQNLIGIGDGAFSDCAALTALILPASLRALGNAVFSGTGLVFHETDGLCYLGSADNPHFALVDVTNKTVTTLPIHADTKLIAGHAIADCTALTEVTLPAGLVGIGPAAFDHCSALSAVTASGAASLAERPEDTPQPVTLSTAAEWATALTDTYLYRYWFVQ